jgi:hypothetical protein
VSFIKPKSKYQGLKMHAMQGKDYLHSQIKMLEKYPNIALIQNIQIKKNKM